MDTFLASGLRRPAPGDRWRWSARHYRRHDALAPGSRTAVLDACCRPVRKPGPPKAHQALRHEQLRIYGFADDPADTSAEEFTAPDGAFLIASAGGGHALACGGWRTARTETAEIKRMCVDPAARARPRAGAPHPGSAGGRRGKPRGMAHATLKTGVRNRAALSLYATCGYAPVKSYVEGRNRHVNRAMRKPLQGHG